MDITYGVPPVQPCDDGQISGHTVLARRSRLIHEILLTVAGLYPDFPDDLVVAAQQEQDALAASSSENLARIPEPVERQLHQEQQRVMDCAVHGRADTADAVCGVFAAMLVELDSALSAPLSCAARVTYQAMYARALRSSRRVVAWSRLAG